MRKHKRIITVVYNVGVKEPDKIFRTIKAGLYRIWCGVHTLGDISAFVNQAD